MKNQRNHILSRAFCVLGEGITGIYRAGVIASVRVVLRSLSQPGSEFMEFLRVERPRGCVEHPCG